MPISVSFARTTYAASSDPPATSYHANVNTPITDYEIVDDSSYWSGEGGGETSSASIRHAQVSGFVVMVNGVELTNVKAPITVSRSIWKKFQDWSFSVQTDPSAGRVVPWAGNSPFVKGPNPYCDQRIDIGIRYRVYVSGTPVTRIRWLIRNGIADPSGYSFTDGPDGAYETISGFDAAARYDRVPVTCVVNQGTGKTRKEVVEHYMDLAGADGYFGTDDLGVVNQEIQVVDASAIDVAQQILDPVGYRITFGTDGKWRIVNTEVDLEPATGYPVTPRMLSRSDLVGRGLGEPVSCVKIEGEELVKEESEEEEYQIACSIVEQTSETIDDLVIPGYDIQSSSDGSISSGPSDVVIADQTIRRVVTKTKSCNGVVMWVDTQVFEWFRREGTRYDIVTDGSYNVTLGYRQTNVEKGAVAGDGARAIRTGLTWGMVSRTILANVWEKGTISDYGSTEHPIDMPQIRVDQYIHPDVKPSGVSSVYSTLLNPAVDMRVTGRRNLTEIRWRLGLITTEQRDSIFADLDAGGDDWVSPFENSAPGSGYLRRSITYSFEAERIGSGIRAESAAKVRVPDVGDTYPASASTPVYADNTGSPDSWPVPEGLLLTGVTIVDKDPVSYMDSTVLLSAESNYAYTLPPPGSGAYVFSDGRASSSQDSGLYKLQTNEVSYSIGETSVTVTSTLTNEETGSSRTTIETGQGAEALERLPWYEPVDVSSTEDDDGEETGEDPLADEDQCFFGSRRNGSFRTFEVEICNDAIEDCIGENKISLTLDQVETAEEAEEAAKRIIRENSRVGLTLPILGLNPLILEGMVCEPRWPPRGLEGINFRVDSVTWNYSGTGAVPSTTASVSMVPTIARNMS